MQYVPPILRSFVLDSTSSVQITEKLYVRNNIQKPISETKDNKNKKLLF